MAAIRCGVVPLADITALRDAYRNEMRCQIIHDSIHSRPGWSVEYLLEFENRSVGYGSVAVGGPWTNGPALYEFYVRDAARPHLFDLFEQLLTESGVRSIETQSNDRLLTVMLHTFARDVRSESILFDAGQATNHEGDGLCFREAIEDDAPRLAAADLDGDARWLVACGEDVVAAGGVLYHYNPPYGDVYMKVATPFRRRGIGAWLVQELKRVCRDGGHVPAARCNVSNLASRRTLQKAGFVPCGHLLTGTIAGPCGQPSGGSSDASAA